MKTELVHRFDYVNGSMNIEDIEIISVCSRKRASVDLCIKANFNIAFAHIRLYSRDRYADAVACFDSAELLGKEIERRWRLQAENARLKALLENSKTQLEYDELQAENAKLKKALKRYGHHDSPCAALIDDDICPCFCGFEQALKDKDNG